MKLWRQPFDVAEKATKPGQIYIDKERCKGCGFCVEYCPTETLQMSVELSSKGYNFAVVNNESKCLACGFCELVCPEFAITVSILLDNKVA